MAWLTTQGAADLARCHRQTVLYAARSGELTGYQRSGVNGTWRFKEADVERWVEGG